MHDGSGGRWSAEDLEKVRPIVATVAVLQVVGALVGLVFLDQGPFIQRMWCGGALSMVPGFLLGTWVQSRLRPGSLRTHAGLVRRLGQIVAIIWLVALCAVAFGLG